MKRGKLVLAVLGMTLLGMSWGCGRKDKGTDGTGPLETGRGGVETLAGGSSQNGETGGGTEAGEGNLIDADLLLEKADLKGTVADFSEEGCSLVPTHVEEGEDGGGIAWEAAEGHEEEEEKVKVVYGPDCVFQIAKVDVISAGAVCEPASLEDVKKQTSLVLYGTYGEDGSLIAESVYIYRRMEG